MVLLISGYLATVNLLLLLTKIQYYKISIFLSFRNVAAILTIPSMFWQLMKLLVRIEIIKLKRYLLQEIPLSRKAGGLLFLGFWQMAQFLIVMFSFLRYIHTLACAGNTKLIVEFWHWRTGICLTRLNKLFKQLRCVCEYTYYGGNLWFIENCETPRKDNILKVVFSLTVC